MVGFNAGIGRRGENLRMESRKIMAPPAGFGFSSVASRILSRFFSTSSAGSTRMSIPASHVRRVGEGLETVNPAERL
jgi:hypothetical protein